MVSLVQDQLENLFDVYVTKADSDRFLRDLQKLGLQPPAFQADVEDWDTDRWGLEIPGTRRTIRMILNKWEPEE